jgi:prepilin-type N-terminal cleavage/methylation domain-containing protein
MRTQSGTMRTTRRGSWSAGASRQGFTLAEVLIALVVLLLGVYAMMSIFPRGYTAVAESQSRTTATQLAEAELARWKLDPDSLPDQIVATDDSGTLIPATLYGSGSTATGTGTVASLLIYGSGTELLPGSTQYRYAAIDSTQFLQFNGVPGGLYNPEDLTPAPFDAVSETPALAGQANPARYHPNWQPNSLYLPRTVIGEKIDIRRLSSQSAGVPFYLLSHAPLDPLRLEAGATALATKTKVWMDVYDARPWQYLSSGTPGERQFTCTTTTLTVATSAAGLPLKLDYAALVNGVPRQLFGISVTAGASGTVTLTYPPINPAAVQVHARMTALTTRPTTAATWPRNAYYIDASTALTGKIEFSPLLATQPLDTDVTQAKVDYRVQDWSILAFDVEVQPGGVVRLPINNVKGPGWTNYPRQPRMQPVAKGVRLFYTSAGVAITKDASDTTTWAYVVVVDRENGDVLTDSELMGLSTNAYDRRTRVHVDFRNGAVYFNYDQTKVATGTYVTGVDTPDRSGRTYRIFCRGEADWAVQLMPAARLYARALSYPGSTALATQGSDGLLNYFWKYSDTDEMASRQIYFPLSEAGQVVAVDYYTKTGAYVQGEVHTIGGASLVQFPDSVARWVCPLAERLNFAPWQYGPAAVRGLSVRVRALWTGRGRQPSLPDIAKSVNQGGKIRPTQTLEDGWRQVILTTYITRTPI